MAPWLLRKALAKDPIVQEKAVVVAVAVAMDPIVEGLRHCHNCQVAPLHIVAGAWLREEELWHVFSALETGLWASLLALLQPSSHGPSSLFFFFLRAAA